MRWSAEVIDYDGQSYRRGGRTMVNPNPKKKIEEN